MVTANLENPKCPKCTKVVYDAESLPADGKRFHKRCFKCGVCNKKLDSTTLRVHENNLFCNTCFKKSEVKESPKIYADTALIPAKDEKGCPKCQGAVYEAEKMVMKSDTYHRRCFNCHRCHRALNSLIVACGPDSNIYCQACYKQVTQPERPTVTTDTTVIMADDEKKGCPRCGGMVFEAEKMVSKNGFYHKRCFTCSACKRALDYQLCTEGPDNELYCKQCYSFRHGHKARPELKVAEVDVISGEQGDKDTCPRCGGKVFEAEKCVSKHASYHKKCFTCAKCKHQLDASSFVNGPDDIYCVHCYQSTHGHKAPVRSMPLDTTSIPGPEGDRRRCPRCSGKVFEAEKMVASSGWYHRHCFRCNICSQPLDSTSVCDGPDNNIYCRVCYKKLRGSSKPHFFESSSVETWTITATDNPCPRCQGKVFEAEKVLTTRHNYHRKCFTCFECARPLDQFIACEAPDGESVCRPCYDKKFGVTVSSLSGADMLKLLDTAIIKADEKENDACPRCSGKVFHAEQVRVKGKSYHRRCSTCASCAKPLSQGEICCGKDDDIYCRSCYARKFGAPGYRGAGAGDWTDAGSAATLRPVQNLDVSVIRGVQGDADTCPRCQGKIFETERRASRRHYWHSKCFKCNKCKKTLDTLQYTYDGPDNEIYCKTCFHANFGDKQTPLIYNDTRVIRPSGEDEGCPRCEGAVFQAESVVIKGKSYHRQCLNCTNCKRPIDISLLAIGPNDELYCRVCCSRISWPNRYEGASDPKIIAGAEGEIDSCPRCGGKVFEAEKMISKRGFYHKGCFLCNACKTGLDYHTCIEGPDDEVYCRVCYGKRFGPGGPNKLFDKTFMQTSEDSKDACIRCKGKVFEAEKIVAKSGMMHNFCLSCHECRSLLDASSFFNGNDGEIYCRHCYATKFGHKQKSEYKGWSDVSVIPAEEGQKNACPRCGGKVFEAERMATRVGVYHRQCFSCIECDRKLDSTQCCEAPDAEIYCQSCYSLNFGTRARWRARSAIRRDSRRSRSRSRSRATSMVRTLDDDDVLARASVETWVIKGQKGEQDCCPKCDGKVFEAEKMISAKGLWYHRNCFRCHSCTRLLDSLTQNEGQDNLLYCPRCYSKKFGPQTRALDIDLKLLDTSNIISRDESQNCPRCGGQVFKAEQVYSHGKSYHAKCANCKACGQKLTFNTIYDGEDDEIYCKNCYQRRFAPCGIRGAGSSAAWIDKMAADNLRHSYMDF